MTIRLITYVAMFLVAYRFWGLIHIFCG